MKKANSFIRHCCFLMLLLVFFGAADAFLEDHFGSYIVGSGNFWLDDYELTRRDHPEEIWDRVFYGNSAVISAYREELSDSGYVNFGVDYGAAADLLTILQSDEVKISSELVVGLNWAAMYDEMETNPTYFWRRSGLEPYSYFQRERLQRVFTGKLRALLTGTPWADGGYAGQRKTHYYASLSKEELAEKVAVYEERYWESGIGGFRRNLDALAQAIQLCGEQGVRVRVVLMPWNPAVEKPDLILELDKAIAEVCVNNGIECLDLSERFDEECFHDLGHLNYEYGSYVFMEVMEEWLNN